MSYEDEYYKIIENQLFFNLPEQSLINNNERIALAVIKNYRDNIFRNEHHKDNYNKFKEIKFKEIKFNEILNVYKYKKPFWEKANIETYLLDKHFRLQFPEICFEFLTDKDFLLKFFEKNKDDFILESLNGLVSQEEYEKLEKSFLLSRYAKIETIKKYEDDEKFIKTLVKSNPYIFIELSEKNQNNRNILLTYLEYDESILTFSREKQNELFTTWVKIHNWDMKIIDQLDYEYLKPIMKKVNNEHLLERVLSKNVKKYREIIIDFFIKNTNEEKWLKMVREKSLEDLKPILKEIDSSPYLKKWINNFSYERIDNFGKKIFEILKQYPELEKSWECSFDYEVFKKINNEEPLTFENLREGLEVQFKKLEDKKITYEKVENNMLQLKKFLSIDILKEAKLPRKNLVEYLQYLKLNENLETKGIIEKKLKI